MPPAAQRQQEAVVRELEAALQAALKRSYGGGKPVPSNPVPALGCELLLRPNPQSAAYWAAHKEFEPIFSEAIAAAVAEGIEDPLIFIARRLVRSIPVTVRPCACNGCLLITGECSGYGQRASRCGK